MLAPVGSVHPSKSGTNQGFFKALGRNAVIDHMEMGLCFLERLGTKKAVEEA